MKVTVVQSGLNKQTVTLCYEIMSLIKLKKQTKQIKPISTSLMQSVTVILIVIKVCILIEGVHLLKNDSMHIYDVQLSLKVGKKDSRILQMRKPMSYSSNA